MLMSTVRPWPLFGVPRSPAFVTAHGASGSPVKKPASVPTVGISVELQAEFADPSDKVGP